MARLNVNGKTYDVDVAPDTPLLWAIRQKRHNSSNKHRSTLYLGPPLESINRR